MVGVQRIIIDDKLVGQKKNKNKPITILNFFFSPKNDYHIKISQKAIAIASIFETRICAKILR